jgi:CheY-like chemotaxis protein
MRLIALTGYGQPSDRARSRQAGFDEHLVKPVRIEQLLTALRRPAVPGDGHSAAATDGAAEDRRIVSTE